MRRVTMREVAQRAGVSVTTVSLVLNRSGFVSEPLTQRVLEAVRELGYRPNGVARSLRRQSTETIGVLIPTIVSPFFPAVLKEIDNVLSARGYTMLFANTKNSEETEAALVSVMHDKRVDGLLIAPQSASVISSLAALSQQGLPVVAFHSPLAMGRLDCIAWDDYGGSLAAVRHLIQAGRRRIAVLSSRGPVFIPRMRAWEAALQAAGIPPDPALHIWTAPAEEVQPFQSGRKAILEALRLPQPPDAIFIANSSYITLGVLEGAREAGRRIPQDLAIVAYDDYPWMQMLTPSLSAVARDGVRMARLASELLLRRLEEGPAGSPETVLLPTELVVRQSSQPARA